MMTKKESVKKIFIVFLAALVVTVTQVVVANTYSGEDYGPFDYSNPEHRQKYLPIVEKYHYNSNVENLSQGITGTVWDDTDYTIRIFPNHHRALYSMSKLYRLRGKPIDAPSDRTMVYYFERAIEHYPHDGVVYMIYGIHNQKIRKHKKAESLYLKALEIDPDNIEAHYNLGLLYIELKEYPKANKHAVFAYSKGFPLQGLKNKLKKLGVWKKPGNTEAHKK